MSVLQTPTPSWKTDDLELFEDEVGKFFTRELAPHVEVDLAQMRADTKTGRGDLPFIFGSMRKNDGVNELVSFLCEAGGLVITADETG